MWCNYIHMVFGYLLQLVMVFRSKGGKIMLTTKQKHTIRKLMDKYLLVSTGCTEPIAIAYASAIAKEALGEEPTRFEVELSPNMAKNAMDAGVPGSNYVGAAFVTAEGGLFGKSEDGFELLGNVAKEDQDYAYEFSKDNVSVKITDSPKSLFIQVIAYGKEDPSKKSCCCCCCNMARVVIEDEHTNVVLIERNGEVIHSKMSEGETGSTTDSKAEYEEITMKEIFEYANTTDDLSIFKKAVELNTAISEHGKVTNYGLNVGKAQPFGEDTIFSRVISTTTSAIDARMGGAPLAVMACTGSGNQGLTTTLPIVQVAKEIGASEEKMLRAVAVADLTAMYIKKELNVLSHLCGAVIASTGATTGIVYLLDGDYKQAEYAIQNMLGTVSGMFCDGAKSTCAMKVCACVSAGMYAADLALSGKGCITDDVGIVSSDIKQTVQNYAKIEKDSAEVMDKSILDIIVR